MVRHDDELEGRGKWGIGASLYVRCIRKRLVREDCCRSPGTRGERGRSGASQYRRCKHPKR